MSVRFSVVIPAYQSRDLIGGTLDAVLSQTYCDYELIVVDNGSTDGTGDLVRAIDDARVRYVWQEPTGSPAGPRNAGIASARGDYVAFCDSDDIWYPDKLALVARVLDDRPDVDIVCHAVGIMREGVRVGERSFKLASSSSVLEQLAYRGNLLTTSATTVRRSCLVEAQGFSARVELHTVEDYELWMRLALLGCRFELMPEVLGEYVLHGANASANLRRTYSNMFCALDETYARMAGRHLLVTHRALGRKTRARMALARDLAVQRDLTAASGVALRIPWDTARDYRLLRRLIRDA